MSRLGLWLAFVFLFAADSVDAAKASVDNSEPALPSVDEVGRLLRKSTRFKKRRKTTATPPPQAASQTTASAQEPRQEPASLAADTTIITEEVASPFEEQEATLPEPTKADRFQATGWVRSILQIGLGESGFRPNDPNILTLPYDRLVHRDQLLVRLQYARGDVFEAVASGLFTFSLYEQDPAGAGVMFNGFNGAATRYELMPELREAYVGVFIGPVDLRLGQQRIAWGKGDLFAPNDVINPKDLRDPVLAESSLLRVPNFALRADIDVVIGSIQLVYVPFFTPDRIELYGTNWSLWQPDTPAPYRAGLNYITRFSPEPARDTFVNTLRAPIGRKIDFKDGQIGARFSSSVSDFDFAFYYHYGFDSNARLQLEASTLRGIFGVSDYSQATSEQLAPVLSPLGDKPLDVFYGRRHHAGFDFGTILGSFALRLDAVFQSERSFPDRNLFPVVRPTLQTVLSVEYQTGEFDKAILLEVSYQRLLGAPVPQLFFVDRDNLGVAGIFRWSFFQHLLVELRAFVSILPLSYMLRPQVGFKMRGFEVWAGVVLLGGERFSQFDYFKRNQSAYLILKYSI